MGISVTTNEDAPVWLPRSTPVEMHEGGLFWVLDDDGDVSEAYHSDGVFWTVDAQTEGVQDWTVTHYQRIDKPGAL